MRAMRARASRERNSVSGAGGVGKEWMGVLCRRLGARLMWGAGRGGCEGMACACVCGVRGLNGGRSVVRAVCDRLARLCGCAHACVSSYGGCGVSHMSGVIRRRALPCELCSCASSASKSSLGLATSACV